MTTRQRKQTLFFIYEQPILMGKRVDGKRSNYHGWNDTYDRDFDGHMWMPSENQNTKHLMKTSGYEKDDFIVENDDTILSDSEEELESDDEEELESDDEEELESDDEEDEDEDDEDDEDDDEEIDW